MKKSLSSLSRKLFLAFFLALFLMASAQAYLDPAATSYIIQVISGVVIACGVAVGIFWKKIRLFFRKIKMKNLQRKIATKGNKDSQ